MAKAGEKFDNVELLWRRARNCFDLYENHPDDKDYRSAKLTLGLEFAKKALDIDANSAFSHKWYAILLSAIGDFQSTKEKIGNAFVIKEHALKASELKPDDPTTWHLLGRWCSGVANISWTERKLATVLFAAPPQSTQEEALKYYLEAEKHYAPTDSSHRNKLCIGDTYAALDNKEKAKEWYSAAIELPGHSVADQKVIEQAKEKLAKLAPKKGWF